MCRVSVSEGHQGGQAPDATSVRRPRIGRWIGIAVASALLVTGFAAASVNRLTELFPEREIASCTITGHLIDSSRRQPHQERVASDCGRLRVSQPVVCTSDPSQEIPISDDTTYDLVVRGPQILFVSVPKIVSATVSPEQLISPELGPTEVDPSAAENVQELQRSLLPESLRAFDYEQPPFDPSCDPYRVIMTTNGLQVVSLERAEQLLAVPEGTAARDPLLPCEGHACASASP